MLTRDHRRPALRLYARREDLRARLPFSVSCFVFSVSPEHPVRKIPTSKNTAFPSDISENCPAASSGHLVRKIPRNRTKMRKSPVLVRLVRKFVRKFLFQTS